MLQLIILAIPVVFLGYLMYYYLTRSKTRHPALVHAIGYPVIGNLLDFTIGGILRTMREYPRKYGSLVEYNIFTLKGIVVADIDLAREILMKRPKKFSRTRNFNYSVNVLKMGSGLFQCYGPTWYHIRKATASSFNQYTITSKMPKILEEMFAWMKRLTVLSASSPAVDMKDQPVSLTVRLITIVAFGLETNNPISSYFYSPQFTKDMERTFLFSQETLLWFLPMFFWKYSSKYQLELQAIEANERVTKVCQGIIDYKRQLIADKSSDPSFSSTSMIDSMISKELQGSDAALTDEEIIANVKTIYMAGTDTTAVAITWICYYFAVYPEFCLKAREEARKYLFSNSRKLPTGNDELLLLSPFDSVEDCIQSFDMNRFQSLSFCMACMKEVLRLSGPTSTIGNQPLGDEEIVLSNGIVLGKDDVAWINLDGIHFNEKVFENPFEFNPLRWLSGAAGNDLAKVQEMEKNFISFGYGPRVCPGMNLAYHEGVLAIAFLAHHFNMELNCPKNEIYRIRSFTACPNKMPIVLKPVDLK
jgi:cytochrome P450